VRLLASLSKRHRNALQESASRIATPPTTEAGRAAPADPLGDRVARLEDVAVSALGDLASISDYEDALAAGQVSDSVVWLWGTVLNRAAEATDVARVSGKL
jgi:hypothetical protein